MGSQIIDSDRRCPFDGKRMLLEIGQDDNSATDRLSIRVRMVHMCLHCDYREIDENWDRPRIDSTRSADRLAQLRLEGPAPYPWEVPRADAS